MKVITAAVTLDWEKLKEGVIDIVSGLWTAIGDIFFSVGTRIREVFFGFLDAMTENWRAHSDEVVGNSIVPDMMDRIGGQFARLDGLMVKPVQLATASATQSFGDISKEMQEFVTSSIAAINPQDELVEKIRALESVGLSMEEVWFNLRDEMRRVEKANDELGINTDSLITKYGFFSASVEEGVKAVKDIGISAIALQGFVGIAPPPGVVEDWFDFGKVLNETGDEFEDLVPQARAMKDAFDEIAPERIAAEMLTASRMIKLLTDAGGDAEQMARAFGKEMLDLVKAAEAAGVIIPQNVKDIAELAKKMKDTEEAADRFEKAWTKAMGNLISSTINAITDVLTGVGGFGTKMINIMKETGKGLLRTIVSEFFLPFQELFNGWAKSFAGFIKGLISPLTDALRGVLGSIGKSVTGFFTNLLTGGGSALAGTIPIVFGPAA